MAMDLELYIQPAYNCITKQVEYAEVLTRRYRHIEGVDRIIKYVTKCGIEPQFDLDVIKEVCKIMQGKVITYPIGINLCARTIQDENIISKINSILKEYDIKYSDIIIEINENTDFGSDIVLNNVHKLHALGIKVALDDFGVEKANLISLINYKFDILKVDKSFVGHEREQSKQKILSAIFELCKMFNIKPIVEGIEDVKQLSNINNLGYTLVQGYVYAKPTPLKDYMWA